MRTTLHIDDDIYEAARSLAAIERSSVGKVLSRLARRALSPARPAESAAGFPVFAVRPDTAPLTPDMVRDALDEA
ncbi:MAG: antitoxin [Acidobacteria bacterium]|nr:antitoxin [Acidobacteriota bacterium]